MSRRVPLEGSFAAAEAAKMADVDVVAAYPITPQTHIIERMAEFINNGELNAAFVPVESEHSAMSACWGASGAGARTFTATASQGFFLMHEVLYFVAGMRLPVVMAVSNRAVGPPANIWGDYSDAMSATYTGWIQAFAANNQEIFDMTLAAFRIAEDKRVLLPFMVHMDGFTLSHVTEAVVLPEQEEVDAFMKPYVHPYVYDTDNPCSYGYVSSPALYAEGKKAQDIGLRESVAVIKEVWKEFGDKFGRYYNPIDSYKTDGAKTLLMVTGALSETAKVAVDKKRDEGMSIGVLTLHLWRPFPFEDLYEAVSGAENLIVFDRAPTLGGPTGPIIGEVKAALFGKRNDMKVAGIIGGMCGRNLEVEEFEEVIDRGLEICRTGVQEMVETVGIRG
ncbi:MAG: pyruvate ferredoxin oxidoreductase [Dehalococcoidia bacterium]|nr:pyruvate ferredoxin oxidoreductase [Dehalococcoidia bacterium]